MIADADHSMTVMREETFGPVVPVMKVRDTEDAVRMANDTTYGLGGSVFAGDVAAGERIARRVEAGTVAVNDLFMTNYSVLGLPMGGWKHSGIGFRHGQVGIRKFCVRSRLRCHGSRSRSASSSGSRKARGSVASSDGSIGC